jgi:hypothetical protein
MGYAHRDVYWRTILRISDDNWILIDLENAVKETAELYQEDIRRVGKLIEDAITLSAIIERFYRRFMILIILYGQIHARVHLFHLSCYPIFPIFISSLLNKISELTAAL